MKLNKVHLNMSHVTKDGVELYMFMATRKEAYQWMERAGKPSSPMIIRAAEEAVAQGYRDLPCRVVVTMKGEEDVWVLVREDEGSESE